MELYEAIKQFGDYYKFVVQKNTNNSYGYILRNFCLYVHNPPLEKIALEDILNWFQDMDSMGWDKSALNVKAVVLRRFFGYWKKRGFFVVPSELIPIPQVRKKLPKVATEEKYRKLLEVIPKKNPIHERNRTMLMMYHDSGCRNAELLSIDLKDINLIEKRGMIRTEKAKKLPYREIFWSEETNEQLKNWLRIRRKFVDTSPALFIRLSKSYSKERLSKRAVVKMMEEYSKKADIPTVNAHQWRHLYGRTLAKKGANNSSISSLMGHSDMQSSEVYTRLFGEDLKEVYEKYGVDR